MMNRSYPFRSLFTLLYIPLGFLIFLGLLALNYYKPSRAAVENQFSTGGTNYVIYDAGSYSAGTNPSLPPWTTDDDPGSAKEVLGTYDLHPDIVRSQLQAMCDTGQRKIGLVLSFYPYDDSWGLNDHQKQLTYKSNTIGGPPAVLAIHGAPTQRLSSNITNVISLVASLKTAINTPCFNEIQFRFSPGGAAHPGGWTSWDEIKYQENWNFIVAVRNLVKSAIGSTPLTVYFDLSLEMGGYVQGQTSAYMKRLLSDYNTQFGVNDTYGFSIAWTPGRFQQLISIYDQAGVRPAQHAIDIYDMENKGMGPQFSALYTEMQQTGEQNKPLIIQETYYNDSQAFNEIMAAKNQLGLAVRTIMQWQIERKNMDYWKVGSDYMYFGVTITPTIPPNCPKKTQGDANCDNVVNDSDYTVWKCEFKGGGSCTSPQSQKKADFNLDSKVDLVDFEIWRRNKNGD